MRNDFEKNPKSLFLREGGLDVLITRCAGDVDKLLSHAVDGRGSGGCVGLSERW